MSRDTFVNHLKQELEQYELNDEQLSKLNALKNNHGDPSPEKKKNIWAKWTGLAASLMMVCVIAFHTMQSDNLVYDIAHEVTLNHVKLKPLEVETQDLVNVVDYFTELEFSPIASQEFSLSGNDLLGGRYCSIQGSIAAQLRYQNAQGNIVTLYETGYSAQLFSGLPNIEKGEEPIEVFARGLRVRIWVEKGLVMASVNE